MTHSTPTHVVRFRHCQAELYLDQQLVIVRFPDGTEAHAIPHDTPEYHAHAIEKVGRDDIMAYCWQHELMHVIRGELNGGPSAVLWAVAHGVPADTARCLREEREAQALQKSFQAANTGVLEQTAQTPYGFGTP